VWGGVGLHGRAWGLVVWGVGSRVAFLFFSFWREREGGGVRESWKKERGGKTW